MRKAGHASLRLHESPLGGDAGISRWVTYLDIIIHYQISLEIGENV